MFLEADFWVAVSFFIFVGIALKLGLSKMIVGPLDDRTKQIASDLAEARHLRDEAQGLLTAYEGKRIAAEAEAQKIVENARLEAERVAQEAHDRLTDFVARRTAAAEEKITQAEAQAVSDVRTAAAELAVQAAERILFDSLNGENASQLLAAGLREVREKIH